MIEISDPLLSYKEYPGPILLLAGPGTGKTWQIAMRIKFLIEEMEATHEEIAVITFTNEAARNMRDRLTEEDIAIPSDNLPSIISTMHSLGNKVIGTKPDMFGLQEEYGVLHDNASRIVLFKDAATIAGFEREDWKPTHDCRLKGQCQPDYESQSCCICREYQILLRKCETVDYDDQLLLACEALKKDEDLLAQWQVQTRYLLVDEFQDINESQIELIRLLSAGNPEGLFVVGDDDQSIYSFRGGSPQYINDFEDYFGDTTKIGKLAKNWRCSEHILEAARSIISTYYPGTIPKPEPTYSEKITQNNQVFFYDVPSHLWEANIIASKASGLISSSSIIIIIPNSKYLPPIKEALQRRRLPFTYKTDIDPTGIVRFAVLADWAEDPHDNVTMRYLLDLIIHNHDALTKQLPTGNGKLTAKRLMASTIIADMWKHVSEDKSLFDVLTDQAASDEDDNFLTLVQQTLDESKSLLSEQGTSRKGLPAFLNTCGLFVAPGKTPHGLVNAIREWRSEKISGRADSPYTPIGIYNMPSSKGLQADVVFVVGLTKDLFPHPKDDIEEKSRLFYVVMTRAIRELYLFSARLRPANITFKADSFQLQKSPFVEAIPGDHIDIRPIYPRKKKA